ncbi:EAL domain-containing protein [Stutzerimonas kunmingensis]|jgi:EAL domain-containing protein (putative c-di-GMP-specific phosphodiesterase class I)|uniref:sensor domain-containing phosphodiesterase n=2 Tax=Stutzerimonas kunmingensis TaxID=1211807 RepID=UPI001DD420B6|nr:EAL domain-containing protein [Stutzerimonas kunmingensis]MBU0563772.1 EAL domain-containing protein [Gammaproteobacteria bacterium]
MSYDIQQDQVDQLGMADDPLSILRRLESANLSLSEMLVETLHAVRTHLGMDVAFISEFRGGSRIFRYLDGNFVPLQLEVGACDPLDDSYCQRVLDGRLPELIQNAATLPEALAMPVTKALPVGAHLSVPLRFSDGRLYGTFCCFSTTPDNSLNERDLNTLRLFADFAGRLLERHALNEIRYAETLTRIRSVLEQRAYSVVYQPIVHLVENRIVGHEALARFTDEPVRSPDKWFAEAGLVGLQQELEVALIEAALHDFDQLPADSYLSLNVSPETILAGALGTVLADQPLARLMLEVTEHASVQDYSQLAEALEPLRSKGLRLAVDDAGAGYASFRHILKLKPDVIKLDSSLIRNVDSDTGCRALAAALIRFAEETGCKVVAEGVETQEELAMLRRLEVNKAQGYLIGRPMPLHHGLAMSRQA